MKDSFEKNHLLWKAGVLRDAVEHCEWRAQGHGREMEKIEMRHHLPSTPKGRLALVIEQNARSFWYGEAIKHRLAHLDTISEARTA